MSARALLTLTVLPDRYAICRLDAKAPVPEWAIGEDFVSIFPLATHDTDYVLIKEPQLELAIQALTSYGHAVRV